LAADRAGSEFSKAFVAGFVYVCGVVSHWNNEG
jgi:hypothetical protein